MTYVVCLGVHYLTGFAGPDRWTTNSILAFGFTDQEAAQRAADRINAMKLGHNKARVEPKP